VRCVANWSNILLLL